MLSTEPPKNLSGIHQHKWAGTYERRQGTDQGSLCHAQNGMSVTIIDSTGHRISSWYIFDGQASANVTSQQSRVEELQTQVTNYESAITRARAELSQVQNTCPVRELFPSAFGIQGRSGELSPRIIL